MTTGIIEIPWTRQGMDFDSKHVAQRVANEIRYAVIFNGEPMVMFLSLEKAKEYLKAKRGQS